MPALLTDQGLTTQTFDEAFAEYVARLRTEFGDNVNVALQSVFGNLFRIAAEFDVSNQELLAAVLACCDPYTAKGIHLDRIVGLNKIRRRPATRSRIFEAVFAGTPATVIDNARRVRLVATQSTWRVVDGPYVIGGGGTVVGVVEAITPGPVPAAITAASGWTILDAVVGWSLFSNSEAAEEGALLESDKALLQRFDASAQGSADGPLGAVKAAALGVRGVTWISAYQNLGFVVDADGIPGKACYIVADGVFDADEMRAAIFSRLPVGAETHGTIVGDVIDSEGNPREIRYDEVEEIAVWVRATLATTTSEEIYPDNGDDAVAAELLEYGDDNHTVGRDVLPFRFRGAVATLELGGIDDITIEVSDDGVAWSTSKMSIGIHQRATFDEARIEVVHV